MNLSVLVRGSDDLRIFSCLESIDVADCDVVATITPNEQIESELARRGVRYVITPKGNPAVTTEAGLKLCHFSKVLLMDSDCLFFPGVISRMVELSHEADIVRPNIDFEAIDFSSYATRLARNFQYNYLGFVYEPGLLINRDTVIPAVGGYIFSRFAPHTPDGEFDFRVRKTKLRVKTASEKTIRHVALPFSRHLVSYWRYGRSEASRMIYLKQDVLRDVLRGLPYRYRNLLSRSYPLATALIIPVCDIVYLFSISVHLLFPSRLKEVDR